MESFTATDARAVNTMSIAKTRQAFFEITGIPLEKVPMWPNVILCTQPTVTMDMFCVARVLRDRGRVPVSVGLYTGLHTGAQVEFTLEEPWAGQEQPYLLSAKNLRSIRSCVRVIRELWRLNGILNLDMLLPACGIRLRVFCRMFVAGYESRRVKPEELARRQEVMGRWSLPRVAWIAAVVRMSVYYR